MNKTPHSRQAPDITAEACAWIAQLETGDLTPADVDAFREWMRRSPRHVAEIKRLARLSTDLNVLTAMAQPLRDAAARHHPIVRHRPDRSFLVRHRVAAFAAAASVLAVAVVAFFIRSPDAPADPIMLATPVGGFEQRTLADGSVLKLNTNTRAEVSYDATERRVRLYEGEAFFEIARDPGRPFVVDAGWTSVEAVGTAFAVRLDRADLQVTVTEGRVRLGETPETFRAGDDPLIGSTARANEAGRTPVVLETGQRLVMNAQEGAPRIETVPVEEINRELSWRKRLFDFSNTPLEDVVREVSRHTTLKIEIADPVLRELEFGGVFPTGDVQSLLDALETSYGVEVEYVNDRQVRLSQSSRG